VNYLVEEIACSELRRGWKREIIGGANYARETPRAFSEGGKGVEGDVTENLTEGWNEDRGRKPARASKNVTG